jgi:hypothetical protein
MFKLDQGMVFQYMGCQDLKFTMSVDFHLY